MWTIEIAASILVGLAVLFWAGAGATRAILPKQYGPYRWFVMPLIGYAVVVALAHPFVALGLSIASIAIILVVATSLLNLWVWGKRAGQENDGSSRQPLAPVGVAIGALVMVLVPLLAYGAITIIGYNADGSTYVAQAEFAKDFGMTASALAPVRSPLVATVASLNDLGVGVGFQILHSLIAYFLQRDAFFSFVPLLSLWHALSILSAFVAFRVSFGLQPFPSILAGISLALSNTLMWIAFDNFALQVTALALLPLALSALHLHLVSRSRKTLCFGALLLAALVITYPEIAPFYILPAALLIVLRVLRALRASPSLVVSVLSLGILSALFTHFGDQLLLRSTLRQVPSVLAGAGGNVSTFISIQEGFGLAPLSLSDRPWMEASPLWETWFRWLGPIGLVILIAATLVGIWVSRKREHELLLAASLAAFALMVWLYGIAYAYGYFKAWGNSSFLLYAPAGLGYQAAATRIRPLKQRRVLLAALYLVTGFLIVLQISSAGRFLSVMAAHPPGVTRKLIALANRPRVLRPGAPLYLALNETVNPRMYWAAYLLRDHPLYGNGILAYSRVDNARDTEVYEYALLLREDDPDDYGYAPDQNVWEDRWTILYRRQ